MAHDFYRDRTSNTNYMDVNDADIAVAYHTIDDLIQEVSQSNKSIDDYYLCESPPPRPNHMGPDVDLNRLLRAEMNYDHATENTYFQTNLDLFNSDQRAVFDTIINDCNCYDDDNTSSAAAGSCCCHLFFIDAPGGTGKTFLLNTIASYFRSKEKIALCVATSGIAAVLLVGGRTAHSQFKIPLKVYPDTNLAITARSNAGKVLIAADIIVWDECPMTSKDVMSTVDRLLQNLMSSEAPFGGKKMVFSGDFRQCLPIIVGAKREIIVSQTVKMCPWWDHCKQLRLTINERLKRFGASEANLRLANKLIEIGNGTLPAVVHDCIQIPQEYIFNSSEEDNNISSFVDWAYPYLAQGTVDSRSSIIAPWNADVDFINTKCLEKMTPSVTAMVLASSDEVVVIDDPIETQHFQEEYLNTIVLPGLPPHLLELKIQTPVVLLRNLDPANGLCNGTRLQVKGIASRLLTCIVLNGPNAGDTVYIPRIDLCTADGTLPFTMRRRQFPVKVAFAMTINKAQGQSFATVGIYLSNCVFGHGQLYVAMSRAGVATNTKLFISNVPNTQGIFPDCDGTHTKNVVYREVLT
jgi:ATP-dependent DNA helicase PIF1